MPEVSWPDELQRARSIVLAHGWNATSYQIVNPGISHWFSQTEKAVIGFVHSAGYRVVAGAPVCEADRLGSVVEEFEQQSSDAGDSVCYFGAEARLESAVAASKSHSKALLGAQPAWVPEHFDSIVKSHSSLRAQLNRARNKGVTVVEFAPDQAMRSRELHDVLKKWLSTRGLPPLHFLVEPDTLDRLADRRIFVALAHESVVAFAVLSPIPARNGWLVEQCPRLTTAPNGTIELLLTTAVSSIAETGSTYVTLGLAPLARRDGVTSNEEAWWLRSILKFASIHGKRFYNFRGLESFKSKFRPDSWEPVYAIENSPRFTMRALVAIAGAFLFRQP
jgi:phosphatidylglycerol lysyltransferase